MWALVILCSGALIFGGCAKQEVVKKEEAPIPSAVTPSRPVSEQPAKKDAGINSTTVKETPVTPNTDQSQATLLKLSSYNVLWGKSTLIMMRPLFRSRRVPLLKRIVN